MSNALKSAVIATGFSLLSTLAASAAVYSQNFTFADGTNNLGDGTIIASGTNTANVQGGALRLTNDALAGENAAFKIPGLANASLGWSATFNVTITDGDLGTNPADGLSFNWGAIPFDSSLSANTLGSEHGWTETVPHIAYQVDTWQNNHPDLDNGLRIASYPAGAEVINAAQQGIILNDNSTVTGTVTLSWSPTLGASMSTSGFVTNVNFSNVAVPGFTGNDSHVFAFAARTGFAEQTVLIDNLVITTVPEASSSLMAALAGLGLLSVRRRK